MGFLAEQVKQTFASKNVGIVEFCEELCGKPLFPRQAVLLKLIFLEEMEGWEEDIIDEWQDPLRGEAQLSKLIRKKRDWLRERDYMHFPETILVGGRRSSKGYITGLAIAKKLYDVWRLGDPGAKFGIDPGKEIYFSCVAAAMDQAKKYQFADFVNAATSCKVLPVGKVQEESFTVPTSADKQYVLQMQNRGMKVGRDFSKLRGIPLAANADTIRGSATLATVFDEMAWMMEGESRSSAAQCYAALKPSLDQFGKWAMVFCNSSPATEIGQFFDLWKQSNDVYEIDGEEVPKFNRFFSLQFPSWELYKDYQRDLGRRFDRTGAIMVSPDEDIEKLPLIDRDKAVAAREEEAKNPETFKVERRGQWATIQDAYLDPKAVEDAFLSDFQGHPIRMNRKGGTYMHLYKAHCDPSNTTAGFGLAIAHIERFKKMVVIDGKAVETDHEEPHVVFDLVHRWNPKDFPGGTIDWHDVIDQCLSYIRIFNPREFTFDQFNSAAPIQTLQTKMSKAGLQGTTVAVVTATNQLNWKRWEETKAAFNMRRVHIPPDCPESHYAMRELLFLQVKNGKVEKQSIGDTTTKDIADCVAECTYWLINSVEGWNNQGGMNSSWGSGFSSIQDFQRSDRYADLMSGLRDRSGGNQMATRGIGHRLKRTR